MSTTVDGFAAAWLAMEAGIKKDREQTRLRWAREAMGLTPTESFTVAANISPAVWTSESRKAREAAVLFPSMGEQPALLEAKALLRKIKA